MIIQIIEDGYDVGMRPDNKRLGTRRLDMDAYFGRNKTLINVKPGSPNWCSTFDPQNPFANATQLKRCRPSKVTPRALPLKSWEMALWKMKYGGQMVPESYRFYQVPDPSGIGRPPHFNNLNTYYHKGFQSPFCFPVVCAK